MRAAALLAIALLTAPATVTAAKPTLRIQTPDGRSLADGARIGATDMLVFEVSGASDRYLYLLEKGDGHLALIHPHVGLVLPGPAEPEMLRPQPTWLTEADEERPGWLPEVAGAIEYLLISSPLPRDAPSDQRLRSLEQLLLPPPYVKGPGGESAVIAARVRLRRDEPPEEEQPEEEQPEKEQPEEEQL